MSHRDSHLVFTVNQIDLLKQEYKVGYVIDGFITNVKEKRLVKEYPPETH